MGALTWLAHTAHEYGRMLIARGGARERAMELFAEADALAERIGMPALRRRIALLGATRAAAPPDGLSFREVQILALVAEGPLQPRDRRLAVHLRAHRGQPHPQHPAQDPLREPHGSSELRPPARPREGLTPVGSRAMPLYVIERAFAEDLELTGEDVRAIDEINADEGVRWLFSFLSADRRHTYCLYEAPSPDAIRAAAERANVPADAIVEIEGLASPELAPRMREWAAAQAG